MKEERERQVFVSDWQRRYSDSPATSTKTLRKSHLGSVTTLRGGFFISTAATVRNSFSPVSSTSCEFIGISSFLIGRKVLILDMADTSGCKLPKMSICNGLMALGTPLATGVAGVDVSEAMPDVLVPAGAEQPQEVSRH